MEKDFSENKKNTSTFDNKSIWFYFAFIV